MEEGGDDFAGGGFADVAIAVVDAALRESEFAATVARFRVELVERYGFLLGREFGKIDAGKFAGAVGVFQKNLAGVLECFHLDGADGQAQERADFQFVEDGVAETFVFLNDAAFRIEHERSGQRGNAAVLKTNLIAGNGDGIIDAEFFNEGLDGVGIVVVHDQTENLQVVFVFILKVDEIGDFSATGSAPGGPEIQEDDFAVGAREGEGFSIERAEFEIGRRIGVAHEANGGLLVLRGGK